MSHAINVTSHAACTCVCRRPEAVQQERSNIATKITSVPSSQSGSKCTIYAVSVRQCCHVPFLCEHSRVY